MSNQRQETRLGPDLYCAIIYLSASRIKNAAPTGLFSYSFLIFSVQSPESVVPYADPQTIFRYFEQKRRAKVPQGVDNS